MRGIERGIGILEDDLHVAAPAAQRRRRQAPQVLAVETDRAGCRLDQAQHEPAESGLAAAGFSDDAQASRPRRERQATRRRPRARHGCRPCSGKCLTTRSVDLEQRGVTLRHRIPAGGARDRVRPSPREAASRSRQRSGTRGQRSAKRQPGAARAGRRHHARDGRRARPLPRASRGMAASRPAV